MKDEVLAAVAPGFVALSPEHAAILASCSSAGACGTASCSTSAASCEGYEPVEAPPVPQDLLEELGRAYDALEVLAEERDALIATVERLGSQVHALEEEAESLSDLLGFVQDERDGAHAEAERLRDLLGTYS
jgi:hypothetical protein